MTNQHFQPLPAAKRRRFIVWTVLRSVLVAAVLVVLYYVVPLDRRWGSGTAIRLLIGILVFVGVMVWQVKAIVGSRYSGLRAAEALGLILPLFLVLFASDRPGVAHRADARRPRISGRRHTSALGGRATRSATKH